jgi:hypothetical protein
MSNSSLPRSRDASFVSMDVTDAETVPDAPQGPFDVTVGRARVDAVGLTCGSPGPSWFVAHQPEAIEPAPG